MAIEFISDEIIQRRVDFKSQDQEVTVFLTKNIVGWDFSVCIHKGMKLTVEELIDICNYMYDKGVIAEDESIIIPLKDKTTHIRGKKEVLSEILKTISITLPAPK